MKILIQAFAVLPVCITSLFAQGLEPIILNKPGSTDRSYINTISFLLPENKLTQLHRSKGKKLTLDVPTILVNNDTLHTKSIHVRGNTSSYLTRKSFNIKLQEKSAFHSSSDTFSLKKFYAVSMNMDKNYIRNKISYEVLQLQNVIVPLHCYSNLTINKNSEGLYMIFYPPDDYAIKKRDAPLVIRRGYDAAIDKFYHQGLTRQEINDLKQKFLSIYKVSLRKYQGEQLYNELSSALDLESYFNWLAFNHLFQNGDYADEVYFSWNQSKRKFEIIPWDFDDILQNEPHEGSEQRRAALKDRLIFSSEDDLDVTIANDSFLYYEYLKCYDKFLNQLTPEKLGVILNSVFQEVHPYYQHKDIIAQSQYDLYGLTDSDKLENDLTSIYQIIGMKIITLHTEIKSLLKK